MYGIVHAFRIRLEHIQDQPPPRRQVLPHAIQTVQLLLYFQKVLKWPERNNNQAEFLAQIELRHVALHQVYAFAGFHA